MNITEKFNKKLLVEGNDDQHVIWALCQRFNIAENFDVIDCEGFTRIFEQIPIRLKQSGIDTIGIIMDADTNLGARWAEIRQLLRGIGFEVPDDLNEDGLILETGPAKMGVWIMPNNQVDGMLEDFITFMSPNEDKLLPVVNETLTNIESQNLNKYGSHHKSKAVIHSWLSLQEDPGTPLGQGITKRYLSTDEATCNNLINWLRRLFE